MDEREFDNMLQKLLQQDFSAGTGEFRDALLARCLAELRGGHRVAELDDSELELLAAAGDPDAGNAVFSDNNAMML